MRKNNHQSLTRAKAPLLRRQDYGGVLLTGGSLLSLSPDGDKLVWLSRSFLAIDNNGMITAVGSLDALSEDFAKNYHGIDASGYWLMPGLINSHTHVPMSYFRGLAHKKEQMIETYMFPLEKSLVPELVTPLSYSYIIDGLKSGVTTFADHYYFAPEVAKAFDFLGVRAVVGETLADKSGAFPNRHKLKEVISWLDAWPHSSRITPALAPHAANTVSFEFLKEICSFAAERDLPVHMHLAQTERERKEVSDSYGMSPVALAVKAGLKGPKAQAVHLVAVSEKDIELIQKENITPCFCPASQIIYEKLAPIERFYVKGMPFALATDCAASHDSTDLMSEMRLTYLLLRDRLGGEAARNISLNTLFAATTITPAKALGLGDVVGVLSPGYKADIVFLKEDIGALPNFAPLENYIFSLRSRHVQHVMIDGEWVLWRQELYGKKEKDVGKIYMSAVNSMYKKLGSALL